MPQYTLEESQLVRQVWTYQVEAETQEEAINKVLEKTGKVNEYIVDSEIRNDYTDEFEVEVVTINNKLFQDIYQNPENCSLEEVLLLNPHNKEDEEYDWFKEDVTEFFEAKEWDNLKQYLTDTDFDN